MRLPRGLDFLLLTAAFGLAAWIGWWGIPATAALYGALRPTVRRPAARCGLAAALAWTVWLMVDAAAGQGSLVRLSGRLSGILSLSPFLLWGVTLLFAAGLGWSAAVLGGAAAELVSGRRRAS